VQEGGRLEEEVSLTTTEEDTMSMISPKRTAAGSTSTRSGHLRSFESTIVKARIWPVTRHLNTAPCRHAFEHDAVDNAEIDM
jgi:hypothetical protein